MAGERDGEERHAGRRHHRGQDEVAIHLQGADRVGEDEGGEDVERRLFGHPQQRRPDDLHRLLLDDFEDRGLLDLLGVQELLEHRRFEDAEPDPQADADQDDRQRERNAPAPDQEVVAGCPCAERKDREVRQQQPAGHAELRPRRHQSALALWCATIPWPTAPSRPIRRRRRCPGSCAARSTAPRPRCRSTSKWARRRWRRSPSPMHSSVAISVALRPMRSP